MKALKNIKVINSPSKAAGFKDRGYTKNGTKKMVSEDGCVLYMPNFQTGYKYFEEGHMAEVIEIFSKRKVA